MMMERNEDQGYGGFLTSLRRLRQERGPSLSQRAVLEAQDDIATTLLSVRSDPGGLTDEEAARRLIRLGHNRVNLPEVPGSGAALRASLGNPYVVLTVAVAVLAVLADRANAAGSAVLLGLVLLNVIAALYRSHQNQLSVQGLNEMATTLTHVLRRTGPAAEPVWREVDSSVLVRGDVVRLDTGFKVPADVRLLSANSLFINQGLITGELTAVEKTAGGKEAKGRARVAARRLDAPMLPNICLMGSYVVRGSGTGVVVATGALTYYGSLARRLLAGTGAPLSASGVSLNNGLLLLLLLLLLPMVAVFRAGLAQDGPRGAVITLAAGVLFLLPELFPGLMRPRPASSGPLRTMSVWLRRLTDPDGPSLRPSQLETVLNDAVDLAGNPSQSVLRLAWLSARFNTQLRTATDAAVLGYVDEHPELDASGQMTLVDELPFDLRHRRTTLVMSASDGHQVMVTRGALESVLRVASHVRRPDNGVVSLDAEASRSLQEQVRQHAEKGMAVQVMASRLIPPGEARRLFTRADEQGLVVEGLLLLSPRATSDEDEH